MASTRRPSSLLTRAVYAALACLNAGAVAWGAAQFESVRVPGAPASVSAHWTADVDVQANRMLIALAGIADHPAAIAEELKRMAPPGAAYELARSEGRRLSVIAASEPGLLDQVPDPGLLEAFRGHAPKGAFGGHAANRPGERYDAYAVLSLPSVAPPVAPAAPKVVKKPAAPKTYKIKAGDTLYQISRDFYGDDHMFLAIYNLNKAVIGPDRGDLPAGSTIKLPPVPAAESDADRPAAPPPKPTPIPRALALKLTVSVPAAPVPALSQPMAPWLPAGLGALTLLCWALGGALSRRALGRALAAQEAAAIALLAERFKPQASHEVDLSELPSPWTLGYAACTLSGSEAGGAFSECRALSETKLGLFVGDATGRNAIALVGRGLASALWRAAAAAHLTPARTFVGLNRLLTDYLLQGDHVTAFYAQIDLLSGAVTYASAAHPGAYLQRLDGSLVLLSGRGMPLGVGPELFVERLEEGAFRLRQGERLWIFTDGLLKAENPQGEPFGLDRLEAILQTNGDGDAEARVAQVREAVLSFARGQALSDDAALACFELSPMSGALEDSAVADAAAPAVRAS